MSISDNEFVIFNLKLTSRLREEFKVAAKLEGLDASNMVRQFMIRTVRDAKEREPEQFNTLMRAKEIETKRRSPVSGGGGEMTNWVVPVTEPANREEEENDKKSRA